MNRFRSSVRLLVLLLLAAVTAAASGQARQASARLVPRPGIEAVLDLFRHYPLVMFAETHSAEEEHEFLRKLVADPRFPDLADDVVIEWGNALHQPLVDRYVLALEDVPREELRKVWRDTTQYAPESWDAPMYEEFFHHVRAVNERLEPARRIRVLLGDPPIDWSRIETPEQYFAFGEVRDPHFARVIETEVLARQRRALVVAGALHMMHQHHRPGEPRPFPTVTGILEEAHPGSIFVVAPFTGGIATRRLSECEVDGRFASWKKPALARVKGTWFGDIIALDLETPDGRIVRRFEELVDALLYLGPPNSLREASRPFAYYTSQPDYVAELQRRRMIMFGTPLDPDEVHYHKLGHPAQDPNDLPPPPQ